MKKTILILFAAFFSLQAIVGCGGGEDNAVKEAPRELPTRTSGDLPKGRTKGGGEDSRSGG